ncbi:MAG: cell wall-binding repeat-containing protein [Actinomycetota bacterium]
MPLHEEARAQAADGTIVYLQDSQIWIATPDGANHHQVTVEGEWLAPSMANDGTILAVNRTDHPSNDVLVRLTQSGEVLSAFQPESVFLSGIHQAEVSPDGQYAVYNTIEPCSDGSGLGACTYMAIVWADGRSSEVFGEAINENYLTWFPDGESVIVADRSPHYFGFGDSGAREWFFTNFGADVSVSANGRAMSLVSGIDIGVYSLNGPPPIEGTDSNCAFAYDEAYSKTYSYAALSPDASSIAYTLLDNGELEDEGDVWVTTGLDVAGCAIEPDSEEYLLAPGATEPFWSLATYAPNAPGPVNPGPGPGGGGSTPPQPDEPLIELVDGGRIDGGGETDPVGQTVTTSQQVWDDGGAGLVVLATADRFPDALAGAALAGEQGPILVTPFGETLDPRVATEIQRVLPDDGTGTVAILGGTNAVSATAGQQALDAAGITSCPAPFPTDCRYAGTGREHTATLVAATVLALNDGSGNRALLARGDAFADAITGGAYAAEAGVPILLTPSTTLAPVTQQFITDNGIAEVIVLGGTSAISDPVAAAVPTTTRRIAGNERTATAAAIATDLWHTEGLDGGGILAINVRHDNGWQTALAAAVVSALANAPQLGVEGPPTPPGQPVLDAAALLGGPVATLATPTLVSNDQLDTLRTAADSG